MVLSGIAPSQVPGRTAAGVVTLVGGQRPGSSRGTTNTGSGTWCTPQPAPTCALAASHAAVTVPLTK